MPPTARARGSPRSPTARRAGTCPPTPPPAWTTGPRRTTGASILAAGARGPLGRDGAEHGAAPPDTHPPVAGARRPANELLGDLGDRWRHTRAVAHRAAGAAPAVDAGDRPVLIAAAWLHDVGDAVLLRRSGFHPLGGAWYLSDHHWTGLVADLVAHHSGAAVRGSTPYLRRFTDVRYSTGPLADALTFADPTTGPPGEVVDVEDRLATVLRRHGPGSSDARAHLQRAPHIRAAVQRTRARLNRSAHPGNSGARPIGMTPAPDRR